MLQNDKSQKKQTCFKTFETMMKVCGHCEVERVIAVRLELALTSE